MRNDHATPARVLPLTAPASAALPRAGECRVVACDPKAYNRTSSGRKRREENKNTNKMKKPARDRERVSTFNCVLLCRDSLQSEKHRQIKNNSFCFPSCAVCARRSDPNCASKCRLAARRCVQNPRSRPEGVQAYAESERTGIEKRIKIKWRNPFADRERVSTLICVSQCEKFSQSEML